jgi:hypothetical protein
MTTKSEFAATKERLPKELMEQVLDARGWLNGVDLYDAVHPLRNIDEEGDYDDLSDIEEALSNATDARDSVEAAIGILEDVLYAARKKAQP